MTEQRLPNQRWTANGKTYSVALFVDGPKVTAMTTVKLVVPKGCHNCNNDAKKLVHA